MSSLVVDGDHRIPRTRHWPAAASVGMTDSGRSMNGPRRPSIGDPIPDVICLAVWWRFRHQLSLRDLAEMFLQCGIIFTHEAARDWVIQCTPPLTKALRKKRHGAVGHRWYVDEASINVQARHPSRWVPVLRVSARL
jgi:hypothetical protein